MADKDPDIAALTAAYGTKVVAEGRLHRALLAWSPEAVHDLAALIETGRLDPVSVRALVEGKKPARARKAK